MARRCDLARSEEEMKNGIRGALTLAFLAGVMVSKILTQEQRETVIHQGLVSVGFVERMK